LFRRCGVEHGEALEKYPTKFEQVRIGFDAGSLLNFPKSG
jgi:hypothetical protein